MFRDLVFLQTDQVWLLENGDAGYTMPMIFSFNSSFYDDFLGLVMVWLVREEVEFVVGGVKDTLPGLRHSRRNRRHGSKGLSMGLWLVTQR